MRRKSAGAETPNFSLKKLTKDHAFFSKELFLTQHDKCAVSLTEIHSVFSNLLKSVYSNVGKLQSYLDSVRQDLLTYLLITVLMYLVLSDVYMCYTS